jgi:hypothetical protein
VTLVVTAVASLAKSRNDPEAIKETEPVDPVEDRPTS